MKWRTAITALVVLGALALGIWNLAYRREVVGATTLASEPSSDLSILPTAMPKGPYKGLDDPRWAIYWQQREQDPNFEWKTPIAFYGKVVDQDHKPVAGVKVTMDWTDLSANGTSTAVRITDAEGNFSIENIRGKNFGITALERAGYQAARATNRASFEYAGFWEPTYHEPDAKHPVILKIRKKGEAAALLSVRGKTIVNFGTAVRLPMPGDSNGKSPIKVSVTESDAKGRRWKAQISVEGGGILPALAEFPVEAPKDGYEESITIDQDSLQPPGWQDIDEGGWFYIKTTQGYGLLELRQMRGKRTLHYKISMNPTGSTNLETGGDVWNY